MYIFSAKRPNLRAILEPGQTYYGPNGKKDTVAGTYAQFSDGVFRTKDKREANLLRKHPAFGRTIVEVTPADRTKVRLSQKDIEEMTRDELRETAGELELKNYHNMKKDDLKELILANLDGGHNDSGEE